MDIFFILLFGGLIAASWRRVTSLESRIADLDIELDRLRDSLFDRQSDSGEPVSLQASEVTEVSPDRSAIAISSKSQERSGFELQESAIEPAETAPAMAESVVSQMIAAEPVSADASLHDNVLRDAMPRGFSFDFEDIFGRRLPIWGGGFALAIAGIFLVRFSIEAGLLTPGVRVFMSFAFGVGLLTAAEAVYRFNEKFSDPRVRQALAGAGLATLYGAFYLAGTTYGLIGAGAAFVGLASVTAAAIALSFRFGLPCAVIGMVGGFAAPLLVDSDSSNVPLLSFYLALITGGLAWSGQAQGRSWLSLAALAAGLGWGLLLMVLGVSSSSDLAALGLYLIVLATVLPAFLYAKGGSSLPHLIAGGLATLQMSVLVSNAGFAPLTWGLYMLIAAALSALGWRFEQLRLGTVVAAGAGLWLLAIWPDPEPQFFALVAVTQVAIFAGVPLAYQVCARTRLIDVAQLAAVSLFMGLVAYGHYGSRADLDNEVPLAVTMAGLALLPGAAFVLLWRQSQENDTHSVLILLGSAALLSYAALLLVTPAWLAPLMALAVSAPLLWCHARRDAVALRSAAWTGTAVSLVTLLITPDFGRELTHLGDLSQPVDTLRAGLRWTAATAPFVAMAFVSRQQASRAAGEVFAVLLLYGAIAQVVPSVSLAWIAAASAMAMFLTVPQRMAAWASALAITAAWTIVPLVGWTIPGMLALVGEPFLLAGAIAPLDLALRVAPFATGLSVLVWRNSNQGAGITKAALLLLGIVGMVVLHSLYKQAFAITSTFEFEHYGMGERTVWQAMLVLAALGANKYLTQPLGRRVALGLIGTVLAHFGLFTLLLHNPLLDVQYVGPTPFANWLTLAYVAVLTALWLVRRLFSDSPHEVALAVDSAMMALVSLLAFSLLRQVFAGSVLTSREVDQTESLLISLLGIVLALGFLWWGSWRSLRSWRIGSLVLILAAVIKVFLIDAAGLEGLLRIASFMVLGFSLIGIGWFYSRQLSQRRDAEE